MAGIYNCARDKFFRRFKMGWMTAIDVLTNQVTDLAIENMKLNEEIEKLKSENTKLRLELEASEKLADMLAPLVFEQEEE
jgi:regulator of replication initiation timing